MNMIIIDATDIVLGRLATTAAKNALLGEEVRVINAGKAIVTGTKSGVMDKYRTASKRGTPSKGPFQPRTPERFVKRTIRGMLPYKQAKGLAALRRIRCFKDAPKEYEGKERLDLEKHSTKKLRTLSFGTVEKICKELGGNL
ncbi:MAG: 50S ribosomal protein L13 [DPANN group archaeon]|nr:50S ribosomal protein L13 [DPANN group archaeon]